MNQDVLSNRIRQMPKSLLAQAYPKFGRESLAASEVISLATGSLDVPAPLCLQKAIMKAAELTSGYGPSSGLIQLRTVVACSIESNKLPIHAGDIAIGAGAKPLIMAIISMLINPEDEAIILEPAYPTYEQAITFFGGTPVKISTSTNGFRPDVNVIKRHLTSKTKLMIVNSPNNPTGVVYNRSELAQLLNLAYEYNIVILSDEAYYTIYEQPGIAPSFLDVAKDLERLIVVRSFSKALAIAGWRLGYLVADDYIIDWYKGLADYLIGSPSTIVQEGVLAAFNSQNQTEMGRFYDGIYKVLSDRRQFLCRRLTNMGINFVAPQGAFYAFPRVGATANSQELAARLLNQAQVAVVPGAAFGNDFGNYCRISFAGVCITELNEALNRMEGFLKTQGGINGC